MSSSTSNQTNSTDVVLLPHPLNHLDPNHEESNSSSTNKPLKRARSPSLLPDDLPDETTDLQTPTKKSRKKRNTTDIDQSLGAHLSAEKLHIYRWPLDEAQADFHVLQEQICDYLSLKSFKRKYPDITRRIVDLHEREYLKSQNVVTETQCDLGLTALKLDEVLQLMSRDYPEKHHQFNHIWQQKRRSLLANHHHTFSNHQNSTPQLLSASISNHLSTSTNPLSDPTEKHRSTKSTNSVREDLLRSAMDYNTQLQRERREDRKACFDLQTMQIHLPANRQFRLPPDRTKIGSFPLALVPGQFQDAFIKYTSNELKYMPINTAIYYYPKPLSLIHPERFSQQGNASDDEEEKPSTHSNVLRPATPQSPHLVNGLANVNSTQRPIKSATPIISTSNLCHICKIIDEDNDETLMTCTSCQHQFHPLCLDINNEMLTIIKTYSWQCMDCKSCGKCQKAHDEANIMFCDRCDRGYHTYCVGLQAIPEGSWQCSMCDPPVVPSPPLSSSPTASSKTKRGRPSTNSRSSPRQSSQNATNSPKADIIPTRQSSRRSRPNANISTPLSPSTSSSTTSTEISSNNVNPNSSLMNLVLTRHQQQWTAIPSHSPTATTQPR